MTVNYKGAWPRYNLKTKTVMQLMRDNLTHILDGKAHVPSSQARELTTAPPLSSDWDTEKTDFCNTDRVHREFQK